MTRTIWAREQLGSYLAGGLSTEERFEIQELLKTDADLAEALAELTGLDERVRKLFVAAKPRLGFEDRVIRALREKNVAAVRERRLHFPVKWALIAASVLLVVAAGLLAVDQLGGPMGMIAMSAGESRESGLAEEAPMVKEEMMKDSDPGRVAAGDRLEDFRRQSGTHLFFFDGTQSMAPPDSLPALSRQATKARSGATNLEVERVGPGTMAWYDNSNTYFGMTYGSSQHGANVNAGQGGNLGGGHTGAGGKVALDDLTSSDWRLRYRQAGGEGRPVPKKAPAEKGHSQDIPLASVTERDKLSMPVGGASPSYPAPSQPGQPATPTPPAEAPPVAGVPVAPSVNPTSAAPPAGFRPGDFFARQTNEQTGKTANGTSRFDPSGLLGVPADEAAKPLGDRGEKAASEIDKASSKATESKTERETFDSAQDGQAKTPDDKSKDLKKDDDGKSEPKADGGDNNKKPNAAIEKLPESKLPETKPQPTQRRIVIRSGDIEFEVDSFDQAVTTIYRLVNLTKGGIIATTNSDKLANGKTRGAVVVRMPPEELDDFVLALRRDLGKIGELKGQRIGSQDVTKMYTDMESELRGLRVSEDRLIVLMKDPKGKLSDLLAVETQLANTRTKIERIEGELRYYANLAAMSTLTINLNEKEIRVAAGVVESERVQAGIEAEDVDKAFQEAKAAIDELKGRVFRSELKQSAAGQFNAILQFEIAPDQAGLMRDRLKQIGVVARQEIDRVQRTEGGGSPSLQSKVRRGDTQFLINIYNLANVTPRETVNARIVGTDVGATFRKLRDLVVKLKGNLRNSSLVNTDAANVVALLDFDIRRVDEPQVQAALEGAGEFLNRSVQRAAESDNVTDTKVRFALRLESVASVMARESNTLSVAALDVPESFRKVKEEVRKAKGYIRNANMQEHDKLKVTATIDFDVMRVDEAAMHAMLAGVGEVTSRVTQRRAENESVTDAKVNFNVTLTSVSALAARETTVLEIAATSVPEAFARLREAATKAKSQVRAANIQENEQQETTATLEFDVLRTDHDGVLAAIARRASRCRGRWTVCQPGRA